MAKIQFAPEALRDLFEIKSYITDDLQNEIAAENTLKKITEQIRMLEKFPDMGTPLAPVLETDRAYRYLICGNYTAFYRHEQDIVYIVRILYGRRNYMKILF